MYEDSVESQEDAAAVTETPQEDEKVAEAQDNNNNEEEVEEDPESSKIRKYTMKCLESDIETTNNKRHWITNREMTLELEQVQQIYDLLLDAKI